ncbi:DUF3768 domain-containing protein [Paracoccus tegillarcae]|uniref:DUF3768 domain-containing protein n=1 Tax=Paracoccus tegillarcae TaxID=1529068 RepID=A0A2K9EI63_9RHOB|nr:DUF3768 domain-containing protein [Paracoccus tegillarcae]AUH34663.1 hypothetical protein CUV01_15880 [Paracoccus tegillarcae]
MNNTEKIRLQNDALRLGMVRNGLFHVTSGIADQGAGFVMRARQQVAAYNNFTLDNDPYGEHDFGAFELDGQKLFFKIDYYDLETRAGSPDPADPDVTCRVLTVMLASEY